MAQIIGSVVVYRSRTLPNGTEGESEMPVKPKKQFKTTKEVGGGKFKMPSLSKEKSKDTAQASPYKSMPKVKLRKRST